MSLECPSEHCWDLPQRSSGMAEKKHFFPFQCSRWRSLRLRPDLSKSPGRPDVTGHCRTLCAVSRDPPKEPTRRYRSVSLSALVLFQCDRTFGTSGSCSHNFSVIFFHSEGQKSRSLGICEGRAYLAVLATCLSLVCLSQA